MSAPASSVTAVIMALAANTFVTAIKFVAFFFSGSGAMLSEAIHSAADSGNQLLLYLGLKRGAREPDDQFQYGYGGERFVFGLLSASGIFFIGAGVTIYHGVDSLITPHMPQIGAATFLVLAAAFVIEGSVLLFALRSVKKQAGEVPFFQFVRESADPAAVAILLEDGAAVLGLLVAATGILLAYVTGNPVFDAVGSIIVGVVLAVIAVYLIRQNRDLLVGQAVPQGIEERFIHILERQRAVIEVRRVKTRQITPEAYKFQAEIALDPDYLAPRLDKFLPRNAEAVQGDQRIETLRAIAAAAIERIASVVAAIEAEVVAEIPQATYIDLEIAHAEELEDDFDAY